MELPEDVLHIVRAFSKPRTRLDWRTCKRYESNLIYNFNKVIYDYVPLDLSEFALEEVLEEWTLFGIYWLSRARMIHSPGRPPLIPPKLQEDYCHWYQHRIRWLNG